MSTAATTSSRLVMPTKPKSLPRGHRRPGTLPPYGPALRAPVGPIHWAGTETSTFWNGYMDGAVRSGGRAAAAVLARL